MSYIYTDLRDFNKKISSNTLALPIFQFLSLFFIFATRVSVRWLLICALLVVRPWPWKWGPQVVGPTSPGALVCAGLQSSGQATEQVTRLVSSHRLQLGSGPFPRWGEHRSSFLSMPHIKPPLFCGFLLKPWWKGSRIHTRDKREASLLTFRIYQSFLMFPVTYFSMKHS